MVVCLSVLVLQQTDNLSSVYLSPCDSRDRLQPQRNPEMDKQEKKMNQMLKRWFSGHCLFYFSAMTFSY